MYKKYFQDASQSIIRVSDTAWIPLDVGNIDYQDFLQYLVDNNMSIDDIEDYVI